MVGGSLPAAVVRHPFGLAARGHGLGRVRRGTAGLAVLLLEPFGTLLRTVSAISIEVLMTLLNSVVGPPDPGRRSPATPEAGIEPEPGDRLSRRGHPLASLRISLHRSGAAPPRASFFARLQPRMITPVLS